MPVLLTRHLQKALLYVKGLEGFLRHENCKQGAAIFRQTATEGGLAKNPALKEAAGSRRLKGESFPCYSGVAIKHGFPRIRRISRIFIIIRAN